MREESTVIGETDEFDANLDKEIECLHVASDRSKELPPIAWGGSIHRFIEDGLLLIKVRLFVWEEPPSFGALEPLLFIHFLPSNWFDSLLFLHSKIARKSGRKKCLIVPFSRLFSRWFLRFGRGGRLFKGKSRRKTENNCSSPRENTRIIDPFVENSGGFWVKLDSSLHGVSFISSNWKGNTKYPQWPVTQSESRLSHSFLFCREASRKRDIYRIDNLRCCLCLRKTKDE